MKNKYSSSLKNHSKQIVVSVILVLSLQFLIFLFLQPYANTIKISPYLFMRLLYFEGIIAFFGMLCHHLILIRHTSDSLLRNLIITLSSLVFIGLSTTFTILFPVSVERSFTVRIIIALSRTNENEYVYQFFTRNFPAFDIYNLRINELQQSGLIQITNGKVRLTQKGHIWAKIYMRYSRFMHYKGNLSKTSVGI